MRLLSGTLADLDVASIAAMTSLGRTSLRLELRESTGDLIGSMVLKAGRVVSATAGGVRGHAALRVIMRSGSDARFELAHEPLDFVLSSALASVEELWHLARGTTRSTPIPRLSTSRDRDDPDDPDDPHDPDSEGTLSMRPSAALLAAAIPQPRDRIILEGSLAEFALPTLLHTVGCSRQHCALEIGDALGLRGTIRIKAGIVLSAIAGAATGIAAVQLLIAAPRSDRFRLLQLPDEPSDPAPLGPVGQVLLHADAPAPARPAATRPPTLPGLPALPAPVLTTAPAPALITAPAPAPDDRAAVPSGDGLPVLEGRLADFDVRTVLEVLAATRQQARLQVLDPGQPPLGEATVKAGWILSCEVGALRGKEALAFLLAASPRLQFRVLTVAQAVGAPPLGTVRDVLADLQASGAARPTASTRILRWAIPISFALGGAIVFLVTRAGTATRDVERRDLSAALREPPPAVAVPRPAAPAPAAPPTAPAAAPSPTPAPSAATAAEPADDLSPAERLYDRSIKTAQAALRQLGYDPGAIDGIVGRQTRAAILRFQRAQHLRATAVLDRDTWSAIAAQLMAGGSNP
ncbi:MAG TPA: peptidoglycan-binding protein [Kofleriaceae bacterium]|nr:peptidoglycan-binding protein [Kofleriaceae bacterium]